VHYIAHIRDAVNILNGVKMKKEKLNKTLHQNFVRWRNDIKECGLSLSEFCRIYDIPRRTIYTMRNPTFATLYKIENAIVEMNNQHKRG